MDKACENSSKRKRFFLKFYNWIKNLVVTVSDKLKRCKAAADFNSIVCVVDFLSMSSPILFWNLHFCFCSFLVLAFLLVVLLIFFPELVVELAL